MSLYDTSTIISSNGINYDWKGDYLGFFYGGIHSSELGIVRISDSDKYNDELIPTFSDKTATVPGLDETYYFGSNYTQKTVTIKFAFDHLTDLQIRKLRKLFSNKKPQELIFDETPYKVYMVKTNGQPNLNYLCFEENYERIYKGDGSVTFIAYSPFAKSRFKYMEDYNINNIPEWTGVYSNKIDWLESSGIKSKNTKYKVYCPIEIDGVIYRTAFDNYIDANNLEEYNPNNIIGNNYIKERQVIPIINTGDIETYPEIELCYRSSYYIGDNGTPSPRFFNLYLNYAKFNAETDRYEIDDTKEQKKISFKLDTRCYLKINMRKKLAFITYLDNNYNPISEQINLIANNLISEGDFFSIPNTEDNTFLILRLNITNAGSYGTSDYKKGEISSLKYDYWYY